eukprot:2258624-Pyramimonas_sp.AAC.1
MDPRDMDAAHAERYHRLQRTHQAFRQRAHFMYRMLKSVAMQGTALSSLFVQLNFNNFYDNMAHRGL